MRTRSSHGAGVTTLVLPLLLVLPTALQAQFNYYTNNGMIAITQYTGPGGAVTIPSTINGYPVTAIAGSAFANCATLTNITIPNSLTYIGGSAFAYCSGLCSVAIPELVNTIGDDAFYECYSLTNANIPKGVTWIGNGLFAQCRNLKTVTIAGTITFIGTEAFGYCYNLTSVYCAGPRFGTRYADSFIYDPVTFYCLPGVYGWDAFGPEVLWNPQAQTTAPSFGVRMNRFGFTITGTANIPIAIEACTNLLNGVWERLQTFTLTNGSVYFSDPTWTNHPTRFYRIQSP